MRRGEAVQREARQRRSSKSSCSYIMPSLDGRVTLLVVERRIPESSSSNESVRLHGTHRRRMPGDRQEEWNQNVLVCADS